MFESITLYNFLQEGHVNDILNENSSSLVSPSFLAISFPGRKKVATGIFHDFVENGKSRLLLKDIPAALGVISYSRNCF